MSETLALLMVIADSKIFCHKKHPVMLGSNERGGKNSNIQLTTLYDGISIKQFKVSSYAPI